MLCDVKDLNLVLTGSSTAVNVEKKLLNDGNYCIQVWKFRRCYDGTMKNWIPLKGSGVSLLVDSWKKVLPEIQKVLDNA